MQFTLVQGLEKKVKGWTQDCQNPSLNIEKSQWQDRDFESVIFSDKTETDTKNIGSLRDQDWMQIICEDLWPNQMYSMEINH